MKSLLPSLALLCFVGACSQPPLKKSEAAAPAPQATPRDDETRWARLYPSASRGVGDTIMVKLSEAFRKRLRAKWEKEGARRALASTLGTGAPSVPANAPLECTIRQVLPRRVFLVSGAQTLRVGSADSIIWVEAQLQERDIGKDDTASSDALFNVKADFYKPHNEDDADSGGTK